jgi:predicted DNA-binding transcriptional regulator YafY
MNYTAPPKKMLIINILDILKKYSDENHRLSAKEIGEYLEREYAQKVDRKAIKRNLMNLLDFGYEIEFSESSRTNKNGEEETLYSAWYLNRDFTDPELRLLMDSLLFSKHIPYRQCKDLIKKLENLSNTYFQAKVRHIRNMPEHLPENKELFFTMEMLDEAITAGKQVVFQYSEYDLDKKPHPRRSADGTPKEYRVSPYQMAATNGRYYLICNHHQLPGVSHYRLDRIMKIRILEEPAKPLRRLPGYEHGLDLPRHMAEHIYMFSGPGVRVRFKAERALITDILDWFGPEVAFSEATGTEVTVTVQVSERAMFYWLMQYGEHVEVLEPLALRERVRKAVKMISKKYLK